MFNYYIPTEFFLIEQCGKSETMGYTGTLSYEPFRHFVKTIQNFGKACFSHKNEHY